MSTALVLGAGGQIGFAVAQKLADEGWDVSAAVRGGRHLPDALTALGVERLDAGEGGAGALLESLSRTFDTVVDPLTYNEADARALIAVRGRFGALVTISSASVYADPEGRTLGASAERGFPRFDGRITEDSATVEPGDGDYAARKVAMERALMDSGMDVSILRPCAVHGVLSRHPREWWFVKRILDGRPAIPVAFDGRSQFHTSGARGLASLTALCVTNPGARILNAGDRDSPRVDQIAAAIGRVLGRPAPLAPFAGPQVGPSNIGGTPWSGEYPFVLDTTRAHALGWDGGPAYVESLGEQIPWMVETAARGDWRDAFPVFSRYGYDPFDYAAEDAFLKGG